MNINTVTLTGNLTRDPELRTAGETSVCDLGLAVNDRVKKNGEWQDHANFLTVTVWGKQAENCAKFLSKGSQAGISGKLRYESWEKDGEKRSTVKVVAHDVQFLGSKNGDTQDAPQTSVEAAGGDEDIPF